jgi:hypothetical protein
MDETPVKQEITPEERKKLVHNLMLINFVRRKAQASIDEVWQNFVNGRAAEKRREIK